MENYNFCMQNNETDCVFFQDDQLLIHICRLKHLRYEKIDEKVKHSFRI